MTGPTIAPYGSWRSPIGFDVLVAGRVTLREVRLDGNDVYWIEGRPEESGRQVIVRRRANGEQVEMTPTGMNARTRVHEYGGGAYTVADGEIVFSGFDDGRLYRQSEPGEAQPITPEGPYRYADMVVDRRRRQVIAVREDHADPTREPVNAIVAIRLDLPPGTAEATVLVEGNDFYSDPRVDPSGRQLAWLTWHHPNMPWDGTEAWVGDLGAFGSVANPRCIAGGTAESIVAPRWSPDGTLVFVSDRSGWYNPYRLRMGRVERLADEEAEFAEPQWVFGMSRYGFDERAGVIGARRRGGGDEVYRLDPRTRTVEVLPSPFTEIGSVDVAGRHAIVRGASPTEAWTIRRLDLDSGEWTVLARSTPIALDPRSISEPRPIEFPTEGGLTAHAWFYPPHNADFRAPDGERPPLVVISHGGPTAAAHTALDPETQILTSRGIAVVDVDYGGSTGYGRAYRERLNGNWGVVDVDDCVNAARWLAEQGEVDGERLAIMGGSAGGYTTLAALTTRDAFRAGISLFGVADLQTFVHDTHKFESRYLERLVGPWPDAQERYIDRSPITHVERITAPMLVLQGLDDRVVPPSQAEAIVEALQRKGIPHAYLAFEGEDHGFRKAENIVRTQEAILSFLGQVFGFEPADEMEPVRLEPPVATPGGPSG